MNIENNDPIISQKDSDGKLPYYTVLFTQFPNALNQVVNRSLAGHVKYQKTDTDWKNWERVNNPLFEYQNAMMRHIACIGEDSDIEHAAAVAWNALAILELKLRKQEDEN